MKEIKFRAWDSNRRTMFSNEALMISSDQINNFMKDIDELVLPMNQDGLLLMQFTGLKDKNGTEIYEGDIVKLDMSNPPYQRDTLVVIWECASFLLAPRTDETGGYSLYLINSPNIEIIGNIYKNPELMPGATMSE